MRNFIDICQFILVLSGLLLCGLFLTSLSSLIPLGEPGNISQMWVIFSCQNILAFILPTLLAWRICFKVNPILTIGGNIPPSWKMILISVIIFLLGLPALNQIIFWNENVQLPAIFSDFETWCRSMEDLAKDQTKQLLKESGVFSTIINILVIGVLTGIGEEFLFRGGLQRVLTRCKINHHVAIWSVAIIFSAIHFQFYGFVPRMLLGGFFGYLYWWSGNIWVNSFAHALNNSLVIIYNWLIQKGYLAENFDMAGVAETGFPIWAFISVIAVSVFIIFLFKKRLISNNHELSSSSAISSKNATESF